MLVPETHAEYLQWSAGDTVYITKTVDGQEIFEPVVIHETDHEQREIKVRALFAKARKRLFGVGAAGWKKKHPSE
jgi:hypothetical protein